MSVTLYDDALLEKFREIFDNVVFSPPDRAFKRKSEINQGKVEFPLISLYRENYTISFENFNFRQLRRGQEIQYMNDDKSIVQMVESLPLRIDYQLDVWAEDRKLVDKMVCELLFFMLTHRTVNITVPGTDKEFTFDFQLEDISDNSDIMSFEERGRVYRVTIPFYFDNAHIFMLDNLDTVLDIDISVEIDEDI